MFVHVLYCTSNAKVRNGFRHIRAYRTSAKHVSVAKLFQVNDHECDYDNSANNSNESSRTRKLRISLFGQLPAYSISTPFDSQIDCK